MSNRRQKLGLMDVVDAIHCLYINKNLKLCPTCGENLEYEEEKNV